MSTGLTSYYFTIGLLGRPLLFFTMVGLLFGSLAFRPAVLFAPHALGPVGPCKRPTAADGS